MFLMSIKFLLFSAWLSVLLPLSVRAADPLIMVVQPINSEATTVANYQPLAEYLSVHSGHRVELRTVNNYMVFWGMTRRAEQFDIALDAAHMTSYRVKMHGDRVIAKVPSRVSYSLLTTDENLVLDLDELIGKRVATLPSPGLGAIRLLEMYPNPLNQPGWVRAMNTEDAIAKLRARKVSAAMIPSPLVSGFEGVSVVEVTESVPSPAISVNKRVPDQIANALRKVLLGMGETEEGRAILAAAHLPGFEAAGNED
jgi:phosphonate transport system substrate-binding protein